MWLYLQEWCIVVFAYIYYDVLICMYTTATKINMNPFSVASIMKINFKICKRINVLNSRERDQQNCVKEDSSLHLF